METLTQRQQAVFDFIRQHMAETGMPPTRADIADGLGFRSANAAEEHLKALARKGAIEILAGTSRGIRLLDPEPDGLPLVGKVAAGQPILAAENVEEHLPVPAGLFQPQADFLLRVEGASMQDAGILDGDLLAVHKQIQAENGQIVVARLEDEVTVKRFRRTRRAHVVHLLPENPDFDVIEVDLQDTPLSIEGLAVGVIRSHV